MARLRGSFSAFAQTLGCLRPELAECVLGFSSTLVLPPFSPTLSALRWVSVQTAEALLTTSDAEFSVKGVIHII